MTTASLKEKPVRDLARLAKQHGVAGWHAMRKDQLIRALVRKARTRPPVPAASRGVPAASRDLPAASRGVPAITANGSVRAAGGAVGAVGAVGAGNGRPAQGGRMDQNGRAGQASGTNPGNGSSTVVATTALRDAAVAERLQQARDRMPVSYTHLTLPTIYSV